MINKKLAEKLNISNENQSNINHYHKLREAIFFLAKDDGLSIETYRNLYDEWMAIEGMLQHFWGFEIDDNHKKFWEFPKCSCPKLDNKDAYPTGYYIKSSECMIHGGEVEEAISKSNPIDNYWDNLEKACKDAGEAWDDDRMNIIGQNGNDGLHY